MLAAETGFPIFAFVASREDDFHSPEGKVDLAAESVAGRWAIVNVGARA